MKHLLLSALLLASTTTVLTQEPKKTQGKSLSSGELFQGMSRAIPQGRVILPYGLEVSFEKTTHLIFPSPIRYVDLGSSNLIAGKAEDAENVLRVKAAVADFETETSLSVICEDGSYYAFNVCYAAEPEKLSIEMQDFLTPRAGHLPANRSDIYFKELGRESPMLVKLLMRTIYQNDKRCIKHLGVHQLGMRFLLRGLYTHNGLLYFHLRAENETQLPFTVDFIGFKVVDRKVARRTATQELVLQPLRVEHYFTEVEGNSREHCVFTLEQFSLSDDKQLEITLYEHGGGRTLSFAVQNEDLLHAERINNLKLRW